MDPVTATLGTVATLGNIGGSIYAGNKQSKAQREANALNREMFEYQKSIQAPYVQAGQQSLADIQALMADPSSIQNDPSYQWRMSQGQQALERNMAARGGMLGGAALKQLQRYGQGFASQEFQNQFNRLSALAGLGQAGANTMTGVAGQFGANAMEGATALGNIDASRALGITGSLNNALNTYLNYDLQNKWLNAGQGGGASGGGGVPSPRAWEGWRQ